MNHFLVKIDIKTNKDKMLLRECFLVFFLFVFFHFFFLTPVREKIYKDRYSEKLSKAKFCFLQSFRAIIAKKIINNNNNNNSVEKQAITPLAYYNKPMLKIT